MSGFNGYVESVEMYNYFKSIPTGIIAARMTCLSEKSKIPNGRWYHLDRDGMAIGHSSERIESHYRCYILQY